MEVYADYAATTPVKPEVIDAMMEIYQSHFGNPSSIHSIGRDARKYLISHVVQLHNCWERIRMK